MNEHSSDCCATHTQTLTEKPKENPPIFSSTIMPNFLDFVLKSIDMERISINTIYLLISFFFFVFVLI